MWGGGPGGGGALKEAEDGEVLPPPGLLLPLVGKACAGLPNNPQLSPAPPVPSPGLMALSYCCGSRHASAQVPANWPSSPVWALFLKGP